MKRRISIQFSALGLACACLLGSSAAAQAPVSQQAYLKASNTGGGDSFGRSVAISGETMVVGAPFEDSSATGVNGDEGNDDASQSGAAYVFVRSGSTWSQQAYLKALNTDTGDNFGISVAIDGDTIVVGAHRERGGSTGVNGDEADNSTLSGAAYVFVRSGTTWSQQAYLKASNTGFGDNFGLSVAVSDETVLVGAWSEDSNATGVDGNEFDNSAGSSGAAYVFVRSGISWAQQAYLKASNTDFNDRFAMTVALDGDTAVIGADNERSSATGVNDDQFDNSFAEAGAAYVFTRSGLIWSQQAYLKASNTDVSGDKFGYSVAVDGETVVVGAIHESSAATGVNGDEKDNSKGDIGAAYVFERDGASWSQTAYLKAAAWSNNWVGWSVAVSGNTAAVAAFQENVAGSGSGAVYTFARDATGWTQQAHRRPSDGDSGDEFGQSIALSGDTLVVGAQEEGSAATGINGDESDDGAGGSGAAYAITLDQPWTNVGQSKVGVRGQPFLSLDATLTAGSPGNLDLYNKAPAKPFALFIGFAQGNVPALGGTLVPFPVATQIILPAANTDWLQVPFIWPAGIPVGTTAYLQYLIQDPAATFGVAFSNGVEIVAQ